MNAATARPAVVTALTNIFAQESALTDLDRKLTAAEMDRVDALGAQALALEYTDAEYIEAKRMNYAQLRGKLGARPGSYRERTRLITERALWG